MCKKSDVDKELKTPPDLPQPGGKSQSKSQSKSKTKNKTLQVDKDKRSTKKEASLLLTSTKVTEVSKRMVESTQESLSRKQNKDSKSSMKGN
ncbi:unnamed protein product, partial [Mesorhabditis belari]|uniref:Uncharacterized protein n=1 Tax=Mesorhabditis belari TaxID=2138241 RepID=A0AAF3ECN6_9BILA